MEGVRRAKAAHLHGHLQIRAEIIDPNGQSQGECLIPLDALRAPKLLIRRITPADETRWQRAVLLSRRICAGREEFLSHGSTRINLARPSRKQRNRITKTQKLETTKENSCESFGVFAISCFRDGFGFFAGREEIER